MLFMVMITAAAGQKPEEQEEGPARAGLGRNSHYTVAIRRCDKDMELHIHEVLRLIEPNSRQVNLPIILEIEVRSLIFRRQRPAVTGLAARIL